MDITDLIKKYEQMRYMNKNLYFDADEFQMIAKHFIEEKDTLEAENVINIGLRMHPNSKELMILKAKVLVALKKYEEAYNYMITINEDVTNIDLLLLKFQCLLKLNKTTEANSYLEYILDGELNADDHFTFLKEVGYLYNDAEISEIAIMLLEMARETDKTNTDVLIELAFAYEMNDDIDKAIEITNKIIDNNPYSFNGWVNLGRLYLYNYEYELSIEAYDFALAIKESDVDVLKLKAITYGEVDDLENELKVLSECLDVSSEDESFYDELIHKYEQYEEYWFTDQDEEILKVLEKKEALFGSKGLLLRMAHLNLRIGEVNKAEEIFARIPEEEKYTTDYYKLEGRFAIQKHDDVAAEVAYSKALDLSPNDVEVLDNLAEINADSDKKEKAAEYLERLLAIDPEYGIAKFRLAIVRFEIGEKEPFMAIIKQITDRLQLEMLTSMFSSFRSKEKREKIDYTQFSREELLARLDESRECYLKLMKERGELL